MRRARSFNPEWGYVAPAPIFMRTARLVVIAMIVGGIAGAAIVFSLLDRPVAEESVAARTLVTPDASRPVTVGTSAAQQPTELQQIKSPVETQNFAEQKAPPRPGPGAQTHPQQSERATPPTSQHPTGAAALAEAAATKDEPPAQTLNNTVALDAPGPKPQIKRPRMTSQTTPRKGGPRYDSPRYYARGYDGGARYGYQPRYGFEQGSGESFAWAPYGQRDY